MENSKFATKIGVVMAAAGSAVGLGNIWRFPYLTGENGGGAFLLVYIVCVLFLGWFYPSEGSCEELQQGSRLPHWLFLCWLWAIRIPVPITILIIFLHGLGMV